MPVAKEPKTGIVEGVEHNDEEEKFLPENGSSGNCFPKSDVSHTHSPNDVGSETTDQTTVSVRSGTAVAACDSDDSERGGCRCVMVNETVRRVVSIFCCFLLACTGGFTYTFGNINPYFTSYLRNRTGDYDTDYIDTLWLPQTTSITTNAVMALVGLLSSLLHLKLYIAVGVLLFAVSLFGTYWAVQQSFPLVVFTYGFIFGVGHAFVYPAALNVAMSWKPERKAFVCGAVLMGYGIGPTAWNPLTTWFINPNNLQPDLTVNNDVYFTQPEVLDKVPDCFLLMGTVIASVQVFCLVVMCLPPPLPSETSSKEASSTELTNPVDENEINSEASSREGQQSNENGSFKKPLERASDSENKVEEIHSNSEERAKEIASNSENKVKGINSNPEDFAEEIASNSKDNSQNIASGPVEKKDGEGSPLVDGNPEEGSSSGRRTQTAVCTPQYPPKEVLKSRPFWTLWFMNVGVTVGTVFVLSLYKPYGQTFIRDDHFLAMVSTINAVFLAVGRPLWGALGDRFGCRLVYLIAESILAVLVATFITCEMTGRYTFLIWVSAMFFCISGIFTMTSPLVFALYGAKYYRINIGLMNINGVFGSVLSVLVAPMLKEAFGWHGMFYMGFAGLAVSVLLNLSLRLKCGGSIPDHMRPVLSL